MVELIRIILLFGWTVLGGIILAMATIAALHYTKEADE